MKKKSLQETGSTFARPLRFPNFYHQKKLLVLIFGICFLPLMLNAQISTEQTKTKSYSLEKVKKQLPAWENIEEKCGFDHVEKMIQQKYPQRSTKEQFEQWMQRAIERGEGISRSAVTTVPVVIHIIHNGEAVGTGTNISDAQAISQIDVLNEDFRRLNADAANTPVDFLGVAADLELEFCLATVDPDGNAINGIHRYNGGQSSYSITNLEDNVKPATAWNPEYYFNIWCAPLQGGLLGYAQFPSASGLDGMPLDGGPDYTDGIVVRDIAFGTTGTASPPFHLGRVGTHEAGHFFGLRHIWGDGGCGVDDFCADTPTQGANNGNIGSPCTYPGPNSCDDGPGDLPDQFMNYMDYSDDACSNMFSLDQKARANVVLANSPRRNFANSQVCQGVQPPFWEPDLPSPPANDLCENAVMINCGDALAGTTTAATTAGAPGFCGTSVTAPGVWYTFTGDGSNVTLSTCDAANYDTKINVYSGTCGNLTCIAGNDDAAGCSGFTSKVTFQTTNGITYLVYVSGFANAMGDFTLSYTSDTGCNNCSAPVASCQNVTVALNTGGQAIITPAMVNNGSSVDPNCGPASLSVSPNSFNCDDIGTNNVTLTVTDNDGNQTTCTSNVTVQDITPPTFTTCPANITVNTDPGLCSGTLPDLTSTVDATDNCGTPTFYHSSARPPGHTWSLSGIDTLQVRLFAEDASGNRTVCTVVVQLVDSEAPVVTCQDITVTRPQNSNVMISPDDVITSTSENCAINPNLNFVSPNNFSAEGIFNVTVSVVDVNGNVGTCQATVTVIPEIICDEYVIISEENMEIEETTVHSGGIGVLNEDEEAKIDDNSMVVAAGTFVKAPEVDVKDGSEVTTIIEDQADPNCMPEFLYNDYNTNNDVDVDEDETVTLYGWLYDDIEVEDGATVIFSGQPNVFIEDFETGENVTVIFDQCTNLRVENEFRLGEETDFNTANENVAVFAGDKIAFEGRNTAKGLFYTLEEIIIHKAKSYDRNQFYGQFIGREVDAEKYTDFYYQPYAPCDLPIIPLLSPEQVDIIAQDELQTPDNLSSNLSKLAVAPNPFRGETTISFNLEQEDHVVLEIYNLNGQMIHQLHSGMLSSGTHKMDWNGDSRDGNQLESGIYFIILKTNEQVITKKVSLIK